MAVRVLSLPLGRPRPRHPLAFGAVTARSRPISKARGDDVRHRIILAFCSLESRRRPGGPALRDGLMPSDSFASSSGARHAIGTLDLIGPIHSPDRGRRFLVLLGMAIGFPVVASLRVLSFTRSVVSRAPRAAGLRRFSVAARAARPWTRAALDGDPRSCDGPGVFPESSPVLGEASAPYLALAADAEGVAALWGCAVFVLPGEGRAGDELSRSRADRLGVVLLLGGFALGASFDTGSRKRGDVD